MADPTRRSGYPSIAAVAVGLLLAASHAALAGQVAITTCGQEVAGRGYLAGDLDCSGFPGVGVRILRGRLKLRGFAIRNAQGVAVYCERPCKVRGPGSIEGTAGTGIFGFGLRIDDVDVLNNRARGIDSSCDRSHKVREHHFSPVEGTFGVCALD